MKNFKFWLYSLTMIIAISIFLPACEQEKNELLTPDLSEQLNAPPEDKMINDKILMKRILNQAEVKNFDEQQHGELVRQNIELFYTFSDKDGNDELTIYGIPVKSIKPKTAMDFYIFYNHKNDHFEYGIYEVAYDDELYQNLLKNSHLDLSTMTEGKLVELGLEYSAKESIYSLNGEAIIERQYEKNSLVRSTENADSRNGVLDLYCMLICIADKAPWYKKILCASTLAACRFAPAAACLRIVNTCLDITQVEYNDCYFNHCYVPVPPPCSANTFVSCHSRSFTQFTVSWNGNADYYWVYYFNNGWQFLATINGHEVIINNSAATDTWIAVEGVCYGQGRGIHHWCNMTFPLTSGETSSSAKIEALPQLNDLSETSEPIKKYYPSNFQIPTIE